jgi:hypothetical protein
MSDEVIEQRDTNSLLDLDVIAERRPVVIAGQRYELRDREDLGMAEDEELRRILIRWNDLHARTSDALAAITENEESEYDELELRICRLALDAPASVVATLNARQRNGLIEAFFERPGVAQLLRSRLARLLRSQMQQSTTTVDDRDVSTETPQSEPTPLSSSATRKRARDSKPSTTATG